MCNIYIFHVLVFTQDKAIRAVFISTFLYLIGNYQQYLTVLRFHPEPRFFFDVKEYQAKFTEGEHDEVWSLFLKSVDYASMCVHVSHIRSVCTFFIHMLLIFVISENILLSTSFIACVCVCSEHVILVHSLVL